MDRSCCPEAGAACEGSPREANDWRSRAALDPALSSDTDADAGADAEAEAVELAAMDLCCEGRAEAGTDAGDFIEATLPDAEAEAEEEAARGDRRGVVGNAPGAGTCMGAGAWAWA
jgi:hypothetical protein